MRLSVCMTGQHGQPAMTPCGRCASPVAGGPALKAACRAGQAEACMRYGMPGTIRRR